GTGFHLVAEAHAGLLQIADGGIEIRHLEHDAIPAAGLLRLAVGHRARARSAGSAERELEITQRNLCESGQMLALELEPELLRIEVDGASDILDLIAHTVQTHGASFPWT